MKQETMDALLTAIHKKELPEGLHPPHDDISRRKMVDRILDTADEEILTPHTDRRGSRVWITAAAVAAVIALVAGLFLFLTPTSEESPLLASKAPSSNEPTLLESRFALLAGDVTMGERPAVSDGIILPGAEIRTEKGRAIIEIKKGIAMAVRPRTGLYIGFDDRGQNEVFISEGSALFDVDPKSSGMGFSVLTPAGSVVVKGTLFTVSVVDVDATVHLHEGEVSVNTDLPLTPGNSVQLRTGLTYPVPVDMKKQMLRTVSELKNLGLAAHVNENDLKLSHNKEAPSQRDADDVSDTDSAPSHSKENRNAQMSGDRPTLRALMTVARESKLTRKWKSAAAAYKDVLRFYPASDEAMTSLVSLGRLELNRLGQPRKALSHFKEYLSKQPRGTLVNEVLWSKAETHRKLGEIELEVQTLEEIVQRFPTSPNAAAAAVRLDHLRP